MFSFNSSHAKILAWIAVALTVCVSSTTSLRLNVNHTGKSVMKGSSTIPPTASPYQINAQQNDGMDEFLNFYRQKMKFATEFFDMLMRPFRPPPLFTVNIICTQNNTEPDKTSSTANNSGEDDGGSDISTTPDIIQPTTDKSTDKPSNQTNLPSKDNPKHLVKRTLATTTAIRAQTRLGNAPGRSPNIAPATPVRPPAPGR